MSAVTLATVWWMIMHVVADPRSGRSRRIINGKSIYSHDSYNTYYFIRLTLTHRCTSYKSHVHDLNDGCTNLHHCGGSLVHPLFVVTACHCISITQWYAEGQDGPLPSIPDIDPEDVPTYGEEVSYPLRSVLRPYHPLYEAMTLWGGNPNITRMTQKRHAASFFPHHLCMQPQLEIYGKKRWPENYEWDVGLVKTCIPFQLDRFVRLTPMNHGPELQAEVEKLVRESNVCLWAGWGKMLMEGEQLGGKTQFATVLQHSWRYLECWNECVKKSRCTLCSQQHGGAVSHPESGDSGSPITCGTNVIGSVSRGDQNYDKNHTWHMDFPFSCIPYYFKADYLDRLAEKDTKVFHWWNGKPIDFE